MPKNITKEEFQTEAIRRMQALHLHPFVISKFKDYGTLCCSEVHPPIPRITVLTPELEAKVKWIEEKYHGMAYHVIRSETTIGEMYSFLYISPYREDWEVDERCINAHSKTLWAFPIRYHTGQNYPMPLFLRGSGSISEFLFPLCL